MTTTIIPARERAQAPIGCAYVAPLFWNKWFRWDGSRASGHYQLGGRTQDEHHTGLQVFADGEWHPVKAFASDWCEPWETCEIKDLLGEEIEA